MGPIDGADRAELGRREGGVYRQPRGRGVKDYHINIFWSESDECYVADIPDLAFCSAFGATPEEALREVQVAKELWLEVAREEGKPIPPPMYRPAIYQPVA